MPPGSKWATQGVHTRNPKEVTSALAATDVGIEYLMKERVVLEQYPITESSRVSIALDSCSKFITRTFIASLIEHRPGLMSGAASGATRRASPSGGGTRDVYASAEFRMTSLGFFRIAFSVRTGVRNVHTGHFPFGKKQPLAVVDVYCIDWKHPRTRKRMRETNVCASLIFQTPFE
ncbi:hypothetical protein EVAR_29385_1 [Eumeta japonica]|uniref:Uncharacterized protein n=1 Tax=Eumeta variegata TaxID=151549 RepID=A0A4C1YFB0_EUMVA|nr:hypothetical protein EVAR_29385_1 [Eumeta japonica]